MATARDRVLSTLRGALKFGVNPSLEGTAELVAALGNPQGSFRVIQVGGTNGKTSTARMVEALLRAHGYRTGRYTSPELVDYNDRISLDGAPISWDAFDRALTEVLHAAGRIEHEPTEFELATATAFVAFRNAGVDWAVLEVGLGGRWDATSVASPAVAVITGVSLDHTGILGDTVEEIAFDKAHIIKPGSTAVLAHAVAHGARSVREQFTVRAASVGAPVTEVAAAEIREARPKCTVGSSAIATPCGVTTPHATYDDLVIDGPPLQCANAATAIHAVEAALSPLPLDPAAVRAALASVRFPGRLEVLATQPLAIYDAAHNPESAEMLAQSLRGLGIKPAVAFGAFADKDLPQMLAALAPEAAHFITLLAPGDRAASLAQLHDLVLETTGLPPIAELESFNLQQIRELAGTDPLVVTGSLSLYHLLESNAEN